jgi:hypothetical protein
VPIAIELVDDKEDELFPIIKDSDESLNLLFDPKQKKLYDER